MNTSPLNYIEIGDGETALVFLHFFGGSTNSWLAVIDQLKNNFKCIVIDFRGFGNSPSVGKALSVNENATDVIELIQCLKLNKFILIGHSMGGKIALAIAATTVAGLQSLILVAPSPPTPEPTTNEDKKEMLVIYGNRTAIKKLINKITAKQLPDNLLEETIQDHLKINKVVWNGWIEKGSQEDISDLTSKIKIPIKIISGGSDTNFSTHFLKETFNQYFNNISFDELKETGHLIPLEMPIALSNSIKYFLQ